MLTVAENCILGAMAGEEAFRSGCFLMEDKRGF
jgi:hypothetical protein